MGWRPIPLIDVFAGPGGLNEGFSSLVSTDGSSVFQTVSSFELDPVACATLRLRATLRRYRAEHGSNPGAYYRFLEGDLTLEELCDTRALRHHFHKASDEVHEAALGPTNRAETNTLIEAALTQGLHSKDDPWVLVGGPPCQAYSLAGRSRRTGDPTFADDHKHTLYREYLAILRRFAPPIFVMENVKGMLSSRHEGGAIFSRILDDLRNPRRDLTYSIRSFVVGTSDPQPSEFVIRSENYGVPQKRHRVILLGVRSDIGPSTAPLEPAEQVTIDQAIGSLPAIRSQVSPRSNDSVDTWLAARRVAWQLSGTRRTTSPSVAPPLGSAAWTRGEIPRGSLPLGRWLVDPQAQGISLHQSRAHMPQDLWRYGYLALMAELGKFPKLADLPPQLVPNHRNALRPDAPFADRFRVQRAHEPSTTVVSHIAKDGHYYIHPDPLQMRSFTVREAARLQTFPDDYFFVGNRTQQYHQVGNAVPPLLARQLGRTVADLLGIKVGDGRL